jgi:hypothetical protein
MVDVMLNNKFPIFIRVWLGNEGSACHVNIQSLKSLECTNKIVLSPSVARYSKLPILGKLLRYIPGTTSAKFAGGPLVGEGGSLSSILPSAEYAIKIEQLGRARANVKWSAFSSRYRSFWEGCTGKP